MKTELTSLVWVTVLTGVIWIPYIMDRVMTWGLMDTVGYPVNPNPQSLWAARMIKAHQNAVENLVVFATLVLSAHALGVSNDVTVSACCVYLWARVVHLAAYTLRIPWVRTLAFAVGFGSQMTLAWQILAKQV
ncbi:MAG: MAPEG family protein [Betaproteobacteria bacterium]